MSVAPAALALEEISKRFGSVLALDHAMLRVRAGHVHALLGENGAGKTTLMHVAFGMTSPDAGEVRVNGARVTISSPADAIRAGLGMVHQHFTLVPAMTVAENIALGGRGLLRRRAMTEAVREIANATGFALDPSAVVGTLSVGAQQRVEIAKALARRARVLILDEPTAVLVPSEAEELLRWTRQFANAGNAVVLITHKLHEALAVADHVTILRQGRVVHDGPAKDASTRALTIAMIGEQSEERLTTTGPRPGAPRPDHRRDADLLLAARNVSVHDERGQPRLRAASLEVRAGEVVGVVGVEGAGQRELLRALAGRITVYDGTIERHERVGFVPEDRHRDAVLLDRSLTDNVALRDAGRRRGRMPWRALRARSRALMRDFDVRAPSIDVTMRTLSGGNQQKLVLAREMTSPMRDGSTPESGGGGPRSVLIVENPTRGLDVRATREVHGRLRAARDAGAGVVIYSSDLDEVLALADRIVVLHAGVLRAVPPDRDAVGRAMLGIS